MEPLPDNKPDDLDHAQWRVNFRRSVLETHKAIPRNDEEWRKRERQLEIDLDAAIRDLVEIKKQE
jgi:hypothetical protein